MFIKRLSINYFGSLLHFDVEVNPELAIIESHYTEEIYAALGILFNIKSMPPYPDIWISEKTKIYAEVVTNGGEYHIIVTQNEKACVLKLSAYTSDGIEATTNYLDEVSYCFEEDMMTCFSGHNNTFTRYFSQYLSEENNCSTNTISKLTGGYSDTHAFRSYLTRFIKGYKSELLRGDKPYKISILRNGRFIVTAAKGYDDISDVLSESEKKLFGFLCFLNISEFWCGFESIRNMHYTVKPLIIMDFFEYIDESVDMQIYSDRAVKFERQVIILTLPNNSKKEM